MNINKQKRGLIKTASIFIFMLAIVAGILSTTNIAYADSASVNQEVLNQTRAIATAIQTRVQVYWSIWTDRSIPYIRDPINNPAPTWATATEVNSAIGGENITGITFSEVDMPADRKGSFKLQATIANSLGGASAASLIRNYLPMATTSGNVITVPVLRPSFAMGLEDILNKQVNRDGTTPDGGNTFLNDVDVTFGANSGITFDASTGGYIDNLKTIRGDNIKIDSDTLRATGDVTIDKSLTANSANITNQLSAASIVTNSLTVNGNSNFNGDLILGADKKIIGTNTITITGAGGSALNKLLINATLAEFANNVKINGGLDVDGVTSGTSANYTGRVKAPVFEGDLTGNAATATFATKAGTITGSINTGQVTGLDDKIKTTKVNNAINADSAGTATKLVGTLNGVSYAMYPMNSGYFHMQQSAPIYVKNTTGGMAMVLDGTIRPHINDSYNIGSSSYKWANVYATTFRGNLAGNATTATASTTATQLATARSIALSGGATGTATAFNGTINIAIPVTSLSASALTGTASVNTTGRANTAGIAESAQKAASLYNTNQRNIATTPDTYNNQMIFQGLKTNPILGNPSSDNYSYLLGLRGWADNSGGNAHEMAFNNTGIFVRTGAASWNSWQKLITSANISSYISGAAAKLSTPRTISLSGAATGTPTAFDGSANISIPVTSLQAANLTGYIPSSGVWSPTTTEYQMRAKYATMLYPKIAGEPHDLYVAKAVDADKLGGYAASAYLRKDEVKNVKATYSEIEWTAPGTYDWVVPEGVNKIQVTTVGGGGGYGFLFMETGISDSSGAAAYAHVFSGGGGGGITSKVNIDVTQGETLQIVVAAGAPDTLVNNYYSNSYAGSIGHRDGATGGYSCVARNGACISNTVALGGGGGGSSIIYQGYNNQCHWYRTEPGAGVGGGTRGGHIYWRMYCAASYNVDTTGYYDDYVAAPNSNFANGGLGKAYWSSYKYNETSSGGLPIATGTYHAGGGGASWGNGGSSTMQYGTKAGIGGGAMKFSAWSSVAAGDGMVQILAVGTTFD